MRRFLSALLAGLAVLVGATPAFATVGPPVKIRWSGEWPAPARAGQEVVGRFELIAGEAGRIENLRLEGDGWSVRALDAPSTLVLPPKAHRQFTFRAVPVDPTVPLEVRGTVNGTPFRRSFRLDADHRDTIGKPGEAIVTGSPAGLSTPQRDGGATINTTIRFHGRVVYTRPDLQVIGADNIVVRIMDDDPYPISDDEIGLVLTDAAGYFDFTTVWNDVDNGTPDAPDVYLLIEASNLVTMVRSDDTEDMYDWTTQAWTYQNFGGTEIDFGDVIPQTDVTALHIFSSIIKADRHAREQGGMNSTPHVFVNWPDVDGRTFYSPGNSEIHVDASQMWTEGTHVHEFGHFLQEVYGSLQTTNLVNGFCDTPNPGHCVWCPENPNDAWQEGWADWFASRLLRVWNGAYGTTPLSIDDGRYTLETTNACPVDEVRYENNMTEGFIAAILRDIEDSEDENETPSGPNDCSMDILRMGDTDIFTVFRDDDPRTVAQFLQYFRARHPSIDRDLWATVENSAPSINFGKPFLSLLVHPPGCRIALNGETIQLSVGTNGGIVRYQWRRNGVDLPGTPLEPITGVNTSTLSIGPFYSALAGSYDCMVTDCNGTDVETSAATEVRATPLAATRTFASWGVNGAGQVGDGTTSDTRPPQVHPGMTDLVAVDGGFGFSMALRANGELLTWGTSQAGELGQGNWWGSSYTPVAILSTMTAIAAGKGHALALTNEGRIRSWGSNFYGQLFTGDRNDRNAPAFAIDLGCVKDIAAGDAHSLALLKDGTIRAVGHNEYGALGIGTMTGPETTPQTVLGLSNVIAIDAAYFWSMALRADGTVWTWGINRYGQLGLGHWDSVAIPTQVPGLTGITQICATQDNGFALNALGQLFAWGSGPAVGVGWGGGSAPSPMQVPIPFVRKIDGGSGWAMALMGNGRLKAWGLNNGVYPGIVGVFNNMGPYVQGSPVDVPEVFDVYDFGTGWSTAHAFGEFGVTDVTPPDGQDALPTVLALAATPNPSRANASIRFDLPSAGAVALAIYDVAGRRVRALADEAFEPGHHVRAWDGNTDAGARVAAGVYFVRLSAPGGSLTRALVRTD